MKNKFNYKRNECETQICNIIMKTNCEVNREKPHMHVS